MNYFKLFQKLIIYIVLYYSECITTSSASENVVLVKNANWSDSWKIKNSHKISRGAIFEMVNINHQLRVELVYLKRETLDKSKRYLYDHTSTFNNHKWVSSPKTLQNGKYFIHYLEGQNINNKVPTDRSGVQYEFEYIYYGVACDPSTQYDLWCTAFGQKKAYQVQYKNIIEKLLISMDGYK